MGAIVVDDIPPRVHRGSRRNVVAGRSATGRGRQLLPECRSCRVHVRPARGERRQIRRAVAGRGTHHTAHARQGAGLHCRPSRKWSRGGKIGGRRPSAGTRCRSAHSAAGKRCRPATQFPLLRQSPEVPPVCNDLWREVGGRYPRFGGTRQRQTPTAGPEAVRRGNGGWHRTGARDAGHARPLPDASVLRCRQGNQP